MQNFPFLVIIMNKWMIDSKIKIWFKCLCEKFSVGGLPIMDTIGPIISSPFSTNLSCFKDTLYHPLPFLTISFI